MDDFHNKQDGSSNEPDSPVQPQSIQLTNPRDGQVVGKSSYTSGTANPGSIVQIYVDDKQAQTVYVGDGGWWSTHIIYYDTLGWHRVSTAYSPFYPEPGSGIQVYSLPAPEITGPEEKQETKSVVVTGGGGIPGAVIRLYLYVSGTETVLGQGNPTQSGTWSIPVTLPMTGRNWIVARHIYDGKTGVATPLYPVVVKGAPVIESPSQNQLVSQSPVRLKGTGMSGFTVLVSKPNSLITYVTAPVVADTWEVDFDVDKHFPEGGKVELVVSHLGSPDVSPVHTFFYKLGSVIITIPTQSDYVEVGSPITGTGTAQALVEVLQDLSGLLIGEARVGDDDQWRVTTFENHLQPGPFSIVARQSLNGAVTPTTSPVQFFVRPPAFTSVNVDFPNSTTIGFSGSGYVGATVEIRFVSPPDGVAPPPAVPVDADGKWRATGSNWPPGNYSLTVIQKVSNNAGGWIESTPYEFEVKKGLPDVTDVTHTQDYQPIFSGRGVSGAKVFVAIPGGAPAAPEIPVDAAGNWQTKASQVWGPSLDRPVHIQQHEDGLSSGWHEHLVTIAPSPPEINAPPAYGLTPEFTGTCWADSPVTLTFSESTQEHTVNGSNGNWRFQRPEPFSSGKKYTISAQQTAAEQTSAKKSLEFIVHRRMTVPQITLPAEGAVVGHEIIVQGSGGMKGATLKLYNASNKMPLGEAKVLSSDGDWTIALSDEDFGEYGSFAIEACQTLETDSSVSDRRRFTVAVLPPVIEVPESGQNLTRTSTVSGKGRPDATVELEIEGQRYTGIPVDSLGFWRCSLTLAVGSKTLNAQVVYNQTFSEKQTVQYNVVPAAPFIETPALDEHVGRHTVVSGFGVPGDTVAARLGHAQGRVLGESPVYPDRTWSVALTFDQPGGRFGLVAVASCDGFSSQDSETRMVNLGTFVPTIEQPATGRWVANPVGFKGQGRPGLATVVSWFNPDQVWAPSLPVNGSGWQGEADEPLPPGGQWVRVRQTITDGAGDATHSDWKQSGRFQTLSPEPED